MPFHRSYESADVMNKEESFCPLPISLDSNAYVPRCGHEYGSDSDNKKSSLLNSMESGWNTIGKKGPKRYEQLVFEPNISRLLFNMRQALNKPNPTHDNNKWPDIADRSFAEDSQAEQTACKDGVPHADGGSIACLYILLCTVDWMSPIQEKRFNQKERCPC